MPSGGSVTAEVGTSLLRLGGVTALLVGGVALLGLLLRWFTGELHQALEARRRRRAEPTPVVRPAAPGTPSAASRRAAACRHPAGRRVAGAHAPLPAAARPRRPLEQVAADVRRLTRELAMVPGGMPMARRRGLLAAYDDVLAEAAELLEVPHQLGTIPPAARELERMRLLACLKAAGLVVEG